MREIKFRAWDKKEKRMFAPYSILNPLSKMMSKNYVHMQYTGLKDKNGVEIYEGDVVRILYTDWGSQHLASEEKQAMSFEEYKKSISQIGVVVWDKKRARYELDMQNDRWGSITEGEHGEREVIGNIYENHELLKTNPTNDEKINNNRRIY